MQRKALKMAVLVLVVLFVTSAAVIAADKTKTVNGTVQKVDQKAGSFTLVTPNKKPVSTMRLLSFYAT